LPTALATDHGPTLVTTLLEELRARPIVCPSLPATNGSRARFEPARSDNCGVGSQTD